MEVRTSVFSQSPGRAQQQNHGANKLTYYVLFDEHDLGQARGHKSSGTGNKGTAALEHKDQKRGLKLLVCTVCELMGCVRNVVLIKCIFGSGKPRGGRDFGWEGTRAR
jgi:hypothetical protein